jgi:pantothenate kinase-related protein Tda10
MITGVFDREGQSAEKKNSGDRLQETEVSRRPRTGIMEGWNFGIARQESESFDRNRNFLTISSILS